MTQLKKTLLLSVAFTAMFALSAQPAHALSFPLSLSTGNPAIAGFPGPYGSVDVILLDSNTAKITFTGGVVSPYFYLFGDGGSVGLNTNGAATYNNDATFTQLSGFGGFFTGASFSSGGAGNEDGFGSFNFSLNDNGGFKEAVNSITFTIDKTSGTWASASDVLAANSNGAYAAAHIFVASNTCTASNGDPVACATGFAANGGSSVPDGGMTMSLLGLALGGLGLVARRRN